VSDGAASAGLRIGGVALSALAYAAAFPPWGLFPLAWVALVPLFAALLRGGVVPGFLLGWLWSLLVGLATSSWLPRLISDYFGASPAEGWLAAVAAIQSTGISYGLFGAWLAWVGRRIPPSPLVVALGWGAAEYARTLGPLANPWVLTGYGQARFTVLVQAADVGGVVGVGMLVAAANAALGGVAIARLRPAHAERNRAATAALLASALVYGASRMLAAYGDGGPVRTALIQSAIPREHRGHARFRDENLSRQIDLASRAAADRPDLVLFSELAIDAPLDPGSAEAAALGRISKLTGADVLVGAPSVLELLVLRQYFNSFVLVRGGELLARYDKVALTPYSEVRPLGDLLEIGDELYSAGLSRRPLATRGGAVGVLLCSEAMFGSAARETVAQGAEILVNPANDSWFSSEPAARMQLDVAALRAVETRRWMLRPTHSGYTAAIDPFGRVVAVAPFGEPAVLPAVVQRSRAETLYVRHGDVAGKAALCGALLAALLGARRGQESRSGRRTSNSAPTGEESERASTSPP
jgi:apolipoprotein N-acyltransferase